MIRASLVWMAMYRPPEGMEDYQYYRIEYGGHAMDCVYEGVIMLPSHVDPQVIEDILQSAPTSEEVVTDCDKGDMTDV